MRRISSNSESGAILLIVIILMLAVTITGLAFLNAGVMENSLVRREIAKNQAFYLAEAGLERTLYELKEDFENGSGDWTDGYINEIRMGDPDDGWRLVFYGEYDSLGDDVSEVELGTGSYVVKLRYVDNDEIEVKSTGTFKNINKTVQTYVKIKVDSLWNNAISTGGGQGGKAIAGNVSVHGSVHILGEGLGPTDAAIDMTGGAGIRNNYEDIPDELAVRIPSCPTTTFGEKEVESLGATLRVKHGQVVLGGTAEVGQENNPDNLLKETMDGVYVADGFTGKKEHIYSDNGADNKYDLGDTVGFPSLNEPYVDSTGKGYSTYLDYLSDLNNSLHITENEISSDIGDFEHGTQGSNYIKWNQASSLLEINGIIYIDGGSLVLDNVEYSGKGTIVVAEKDTSGNITGGEIRVNGNLLAQGTYESGDGFPNNVLGLITNNLWLTAGPQEAMTGAFYAENQITNKKQTELAGTFISNYFDLQQVPKIYEVPMLANSLQTEMMNVGAPNWIVTTSKWQES